MKYVILVLCFFIEIILKPKTHLLVDVWVFSCGFPLIGKFWGSKINSSGC